MIEAAIRLFKTLPPEKRGYIINQIISVSGLSSPRSLYAKRTDQERYGIPLRGPQLYRRLLFQHLVNQCL